MIFTARSFVAALTVVSLPLTSANVYRRHDDGPNSQESSKSHSSRFDGGNNSHTTGTAPTSSGVCIVADGKVVGLGDDCGGFTRSAPQCGAGLSCKLGPVADAGGQCQLASPDALPDILQHHPSVLSTSSTKKVRPPVSSTAAAGIHYGVEDSTSTTAYPMPASAPAGMNDYGGVISAAFDSRPVAPSATMAACLAVLVALFL
ncbi:hypothetical protein BSLG_010412 [Batrachochytrium salamandrivorans]|nr:hypothetical protein BSLG_010412 [Batrachochytrium salamandrivorans]